MIIRDIFGILLRCVCLFLVFWGLWNLVAAAKYLIHAVVTLNLNAAALEGPYDYFAYGLPALLVGVAGLRYADALVDFTYRRHRLPPVVPLSAAPVSPPYLSPGASPSSAATPAPGESHDP
jgi:hypothetical protein